MTDRIDYSEQLPEGAEVRSVPFREFRADEDDGSVTIEGHAATFNDVYSVGPFREQIAPGAFEQSIQDDDVRALFNHNPDFPLGRQSAGTLELSEDDTGLFTRTELPQSAERVREAIERGDVQEMSFGFEVLEESFDHDEDGTELRTIERAKLYDVSPVTYPANANTDVALRSLEAWRETRDEAAETAAGGDAGDDGGDALTIRVSADEDQLRKDLARASESLELEGMAEALDALRVSADDSIDGLAGLSREGLDDLWASLDREPPTRQEIADKLERTAARIRKIEDRQSRPDFEGTEEIVPDWVDEGTWDRPALSDHPEAEEGTDFNELEADAQDAIRGRFIEQDGDTYAELSNPVVNPATDRLNRNGVLAARQRPASEAAEQIADALWEEHFEDEENAGDPDLLSRLTEIEAKKGDTL